MATFPGAPPMISDQEAATRALTRKRARDVLGGVAMFLGELGGFCAYLWLSARLGVQGHDAAAVGVSIAAAAILAVLLWWNPRTERLYWREVPR